MQFCQQPPSIQAVLPNHDDLLFFVYWTDLSKTKGSRIFARRKQKLKNKTDTNSGGISSNNNTSALPLDLAWNNPLAAEIDWRSSLLLNLVLQTQYLLTVVCCPPTELDQLLDRTESPLKKTTTEHSTHSRQSIIITKCVHASPSTTPVNLDQTKSSDSAPSVSYPDICFAVDDFVEAFDSLTLVDPDECYCVVLHADVANTWSKAAAATSFPQNLEHEGEEEEEKTTEVGQPTSSPIERSLEAAFEESLQIATPVPPLSKKEPSIEGTISVFNGYVSCKQFSASLQAYLRNPIKILLQQGRRSGQKGGQGQTAKVLMHGPGGIGSAEVAVTALDSENSSGRGPSLAESVFKSAVAAVKTAVQVGEQSGGSGAADVARKLQCALMAVNVPVEALAEQILKAIEV